MIEVVDLMLRIFSWRLPGDAEGMVACTSEDVSRPASSTTAVEVSLLYAMVRQQQSTCPLRYWVPAAESVDTAAILANLLAA